MDYRVELRDKEMDFVTILDNRIQNLKWSYERIGGCGSFSFKVSSKYCTEIELGANYNIRIKRKNLTTRDYELIYQGRIETTEYSVTDNSKETITIQGFGYQSTLKDIVINETYNSTEVSEIIKDILDSYVTPNTDVSYNSGDIEATTFTPDSIQFSYITVADAFKQLADIVGSREYGVDKDRKFFFKARAGAVEEDYRFVFGKDLSSFRLNSSCREVVNRIIVIGGDVSGSKYVYTKDYARNQGKYGRRDSTIINSAVITDAVAEQLADAEQAEGNEPVDRGTFTLVRRDFLENTIPLPLVEIVTRQLTWNEKTWNSFLWAGQPPFRLNTISYSLTTDGFVKTECSFGRKVSLIAEDVKRLKYELDQLNQSRS
jgi:hypothetical protein